MVADSGLEPEQPKPADFKSAVSTNFTTPRWLDYLVRTERVELSHLTAPEPKSGASANSATFAK